MADDNTPATCPYCNQQLPASTADTIGRRRGEGGKYYTARGREARRFEEQYGVDYNTKPQGP